MESIIYNKYSNERDPKFNIRTEIVLDDGTKKVCKYATNKESELHVAQMYNTYVNFQKMHADDTLQLCECQKEDNRVVFSFME